MSEPLVHFVYLGGELLWQHRRAIETADVHGARRILWTFEDPETTSDRLFVAGGGGRIAGVDVTQIFEGNQHLEHPIQLANVKDLYAWKILHEYGGLYLDLDTVSLRPAWDLLTRDVCVSLEHEPGFDLGHPYNSAVVLGRQGAPALLELRKRASAVLNSGESRWGKCGPHLLTDVVAEHPDAFDIAPFGVLNGWRDDTIHRYYEGERPGPDVRVVHLFSSSRMDDFRADRWMPGTPPPATLGEARDPRWLEP